MPPSQCPRVRPLSSESALGAQTGGEGNEESPLLRSAPAPSLHTPPLHPLFLGSFPSITFYYFLYLPIPPPVSLGPEPNSSLPDSAALKGTAALVTNRPTNRYTTCDKKNRKQYCHIVKSWEGERTKRAKGRIGLTSPWASVHSRHSLGKKPWVPVLALVLPWISCCHSLGLSSASVQRLSCSQ